MYPLPLEFGELAAGVPVTEWAELTEKALLKRINKLCVNDTEMDSISDVKALLSIVRSALLPDIPGILMGFADGKLNCVSPGTMCIERADGKGPTQISVQTWNSIHKLEDEEEKSFFIHSETVKSNKLGNLKSISELLNRRPKHHHQAARHLVQSIDSKRFWMKIGMIL